MTNNAKKAELSTVIESLRHDLDVAMQKGKGKGIRFNIESMEVELKTTASVETGGKGGVKFWLAELGGDYKDKNETIHTIRLKLNPVTVEENADGEKKENRIALSAEE